MSMTTPRVTVPVKGQSFAHEQEWINRASRVLTAHPDYNNTEHGETNGWRGNHFTALCFDQAGNRMRCGADFKRATKEATYPVWWVWPDQIAAMLSAAPAPEGGVVSRDQVLAIVRQFASPSWCSVDRLVDTLCAALATREEAPAEAGERERLIQDLSDAESWRRLPGNENHLATADLFARAISALRAQPPAREDAQPVADEVLPVAWVIRTKDGHIRMWTMNETRAKTAAEAWGMEARQEGLSPITHPAPDALRVAVEALEKISNRRSIVFGRGEMSGQEAFGIATEALAALAALQSEQGAK